MNICANDEHVPEIKRYIQTIKVRVQAISTTFPQQISTMSNCQDGVQLWLLAEKLY